MQESNNIFYTKAYFGFIEDSEKAKVKVFNYSEGKKNAYFPYVLKDGVAVSLRYGGIYTNCTEMGFSEKVQSCFKEYCETNNIWKIQIRENPFIQTIKIGALAEREPFVFIDLTESEDKLMSAISRRHINCIQKATKQGLALDMGNDLKYLDIFYRFYKDTLIQKGVVPQKFSYFTKLFLYLKDNLQLVCIRREEVLVAVSIILKSDGNAFMLYGGMSQEGYAKYAKYFMIVTLLSKYKKMGYERFVLGTGHKGMDAIYQFKRGFTDRDEYIQNYECRI